MRCEYTVEFSVMPINFHTKETQKIAKLEIFRDESMEDSTFIEVYCELFIIHACCEENTTKFKVNQITQTERKAS